MTQQKKYKIPLMLFEQFPVLSLDNPKIIELKNQYVSSSGDTYALLKDRGRNVYFLALNEIIILVTLNDTLAYNAYDRAVKLYSQGV